MRKFISKSDPHVYSIPKLAKKPTKQKLIKLIIKSALLPTVFQELSKDYRLTNLGPGSLKIQYISTYNIHTVQVTGIYYTV